MRLYVLALFVASCMSLSLVAGRMMGKKGVVSQVSPPQEVVMENTTHLRVVPVSSTPVPSTAALFIQYPKEGTVLSGNPVWMQVRVTGYVLGSDSDFDRSSEIYNSDMGQTLRVVVDNASYIPINGPSLQPFNEDGFYYDQNYKFQLPMKLQEGFHTLRVYLARSYGESLQEARTFQASYFYVGKQEDRSQIPFLSKPYLTYNEPSEMGHYTEDLPILLDFYLSNCDLSSDGYKVRLSIDGAGVRTLTAWQPYYLYGLSRGRHTIRLELLDAQNRLVPGPFNDNVHKIVVR
jgi:hypothetical protein